MENKDFQDFLTALGITASVLTIWPYCPALAVGSAVAIAYHLYRMKKQENKD
ncbi:hypothetical protein IQ264_20815 [Phormidium sp. LEGE 05292]|uniref:hypothetical protein n=1 Tax=[Phormidium] sp. LEGE 05292 TaxID=767427 RepID=UPI001881F28B|nr:hypothetical protein [Phormidium sp. LEGE 05292]MBE9227868.1 hypothetical protein [Phormidium sp. LEGE 05292]